VFAGLSIIGGQICFVYNLWKTWRLSVASAAILSPLPRVETADRAWAGA
jgi:hypothetical protein